MNSEFWTKCSDCGDNFGFDLRSGSCKTCNLRSLGQSEFNEGDAVEAFGVRGTVRKSANKAFLVARFDDKDVVFQLDGKLFSWAKEPQLRKI